MTFPLSAQRIFALAACHPDQIAIEVVAQTGSTNADLLARINNTDTAAPTTPILRIAEQQTAGRGRAGRSWLSAPSAALMFSLGWHFEQPLHTLVGLPLAVGVAIVTALNTYLGQAPGESAIGLKWPNDVLQNGDKLGGILIETASAGGSKGERSTWAVIGVGINLAISDEMAQQLGRRVANLPLPADAIATDRNLLMAIILESLTQTLEQFAQHGLKPFIAPWMQLHAYTGQPIVIVDQGKILHEGIALGIDETGRFLLQTAQQEQPVAIMAGDISLRLKEV
ncbi:biotin--[acetyl-CoA-carboxylase] ligase [Glaciimonas sp. GG7]